MPSAVLAVSVSDILEVRGGPLRESEVWALLCQSAAAIQDFFIKGASASKDDALFAVSPTTLMMSRDGQVTLTPGDNTWHGTDFVAPEYSDSANALSDTAIEKMFLYTLGKTLQVATEFGLHRNEYVSVSHHLDSLLEAMCEENPAVRMGLRPILEACDLHTRQHPDKSPYAQTIARLYGSVLGSIDQTGHVSSDSSRQSTLTLRSRRRPRHPHHLHQHRRRSSLSSQSPSPTRSRSRSRSRSRDGVNHPAEKPYEEETENTANTNSNAHQTSSSPSHTKAAATAATPQPPVATALTSKRDPLSSQDLNSSFAFTAEDGSSLYRGTPAYGALAPPPGLLGLRMGSPAYEKYLQLKERQRRLKAARTGEKAEDGGGGRGEGMGMSAPHLMPPPSSMWRGDMMDYATDSRSMASLMSYSLGTYMPELTSIDSQGPASLTHDEDHDGGSLLSSELSFLTSEGPQMPANRPNHSSPDEKKQPPGKPPPSLKRQREDDAYPEQPEREHHEARKQQQEQQQQKSKERPRPPQQLLLKVDNRDQQTQQMQQFSDRDITPTPEAGPPREFYGPEFVYRASRPVIRISLPLQGESLKNPAVARRVIVVHLTGQKFEAIVDPCMTGRQLFDAVVTHTALDDFFFFGLTYVCEAEHFFLDADTKLHKMAPEGWREGAKGHMPPVTYTLYLRVKFYPDSLADFRHASSQHLLYLQLRRDLLEERCTAGDETLLGLAGLALHAEFGDYSRRTMGHNYFVPDQYLPARTARRLGMGLVHDRALEAHRKALGLAPAQCQIQFIKMVQGLPEYGIHYYKLMKAKNDSSSVVWVGLTQTSLLIGEQTGPQRLVTRGLPWPSIMKISFNKRRFSVQPKVDPATHIKGKPPKVNFFTSSYRKGRYLLQLSTAQHRFHIRMRTRAAALEDMGGEGLNELYESEDVQSASFMPVAHEPVAGEDAEEEEEEEVVVVEPEEEELRHMKSPSAHSMSKSSNNDSGSTTSPEPEERPEAPPLKYRSPPPYRPNLDLFMEEIRTASPPAGRLGWFGGSKQSNLHDVTDVDMRQNGATSSTADLSASPQLTEFTDPESSSSHHPSSEPHQTSPPPPPPPPPYLPSAQSSLGRHVFEVTLLKEGDKGIGITIVGGETTSSLDLGIFVKSVVKDGPAARAGLVRAGDRLIAINGVSLEGVQHHEAVQLIRDSVSSVTLLVSQMRAPATIKRKVAGSREELDIDEDDGVCHSDSDEDDRARRTGEYHASPSHLGSIALLADMAAEDSSSHPHPSQLQASLYSSLHSSLRSSLHSLNQDFVDLADIEEFRSNNAAEFSEPEHTDADSVYVDARDEVLLSEEMLAAAELDTRSYGSSDINRAMEGESDKEIQELEILGDIANMTVDNSDTDSDFESAVKATVDGRASLPLNSQSHSEGTKQTRRRASVSSPNTVIYEVVLEKQNGSLGIVTSANPEGDDRILIQSLVPGGPADRGGILHPGDYLLAVNSTPLQGYSPATADKQLASAPDLCLLKVARTKSLDVQAQSTQEEKAKGSAAKGSPAWQKQEQHSPPGRPPSQPTAVASGASSPREGQDFPIRPPSAFASGAPTPVSEFPPSIVPPPLNFDTLRVEDERSYNTQSDIDSDVLDSSRSELEKIYVDAEKYLNDDDDDVDDDDYDLDAALKAAAAGSDDMYLADAKSGGQRSDRSKGDVSPTDTIKNESPTNVHSSSANLLSSLSQTSELVNRKSLVRQEKVRDATGDSKRPADQKRAVDGTQDFRVELRKSPGGGLGFTVVGGVSTTGGCYVKAVVQDPALSDGRLRPGDRLIQVNGQDMTGLSHFEAVTFLRQTPREVSIQVQRDADARQPSLNPPQTASAPGPPAYADNQQERHIQKPSRHARPGEKSSESGRDQEQRPQDGAEGVEDPHRSANKDPVRGLDTPKAIIRPYEYARRDGQTDRPAAGRETEEEEEEDEAVRNLEFFNKERRTSEVFDILLEKQLGFGAEWTTGVLQILLEKPQLTDSLGFSLVQRRVDGHSGIFFKTLTPGGIAQLDGQLRVRDRLLQVNGVSLIGCSHTKAIRILREASGSVLLTISRSLDVHPDSDAGSSIRSDAASDLDSDTNPQPTPSESASSECTNGEINDMLDQAMDYLEKHEDEREARSPTTPTDTREQNSATRTTTTTTPVRRNEAVASSSTPRSDAPARPKPKAKPRSRRGSTSSASSGQTVGDSSGFQSQAISASASASAEGRGKQRTGASEIESETKKKDRTKEHEEEEEGTDEEFAGGYIRDFPPEELPEEMSEEALVSLAVLSLGAGAGAGAEERTTDLLQLLADAVELEEPLLEFQRLRQMKATDNCEVAKLLENKPRNRYRNVLPYDFNRVKLHTDATDDNDYINASDVRLRVTADEDQPEQELRYLACQGPLAATVGHFWRMVWQTRASVIAMLTQQVELGKVKCHQYWPHLCHQPLEVDDGELTVVLEKEQSLDDFEVRHLRLVERESGEERLIVHLHYTTWPDHGVPDTAFPLLRFLRLMHQFHRSGPFVVHCSAGIGRSGVLMAVDTALARTENGQDEVELFEILSELRRQRYGMVQTQDQYLFCYTACMEALLSLEG